MTFDSLVRVVQCERDRLRGVQKRGWYEQYYNVMKSRHVRALLGWQLPPIEDVTERIDARGGRVRAVRLDALAGGIGLKQPVVGGLLVRAALKRPSGESGIAGIMDGGNVSTGLALGHFAKRFGLRARLVMSSFFPRDIRRFIEKASEGRLETILAPHYGLGRERDFYRHLCVVARDRRLSRGFACLWHAKYGGDVMRPLGEELAASIDEMPDVIVLVIGAGATFEGVAIPIQERFGMLPRIVVVEHELCPLVQIDPKATSCVSGHPIRQWDTDWLRTPPNGIPHSVLGPHYDELNPFIDGSLLARIDGVVRYGDEEWKQMASHCRTVGLSVGNSSAVNLLVARHLAEAGLSVLTFIYEPCRSYYMSPLAAACHRSGAQKPATESL